ncbi:MAG: hypothetical protein JRI92_00445 [Deltaproteobacteria bacterium]|nr:hypothetical protein [Deltaproteobacteria bacterium]
MKTDNLYSSAHLFVAAIRVCEHQKSAPPSIDDVCRSISFSLERGNFICKQLKEMEIIEAVEGPYGVRLSVKNHIKIEDIPREEKESALSDELAKFKETQKSFAKKIESFTAKQKEKKESLFSDIEKKLKKELDKKL